MKFYRVILIVLVVVVATLVVACGGDDAEPTAAPEVEMSLAVEPEPAAVGPSTLLITLVDANGNAIDGATVAVHGDMDHEGMMPVDGTAESGDDGVYRVPFEWSMGGGWILDVTATLPDDGGQVSERFELDVEAISTDSIINQDRDLDASIGIDYEPDNDPALAGEGTVIVTVTDAEGQPISGASVSLIATMDHEGMVPVMGHATSEEDGEYMIPINWTMAGDWQVVVTVETEDDRTNEATFDQTVIMAEDGEMDMDNMDGIGDMEATEETPDD